MSQKKEIVVGNKYGRLTVIEPIGKNYRGEKIWRCVCECGTYTEACSRDLNSGHKQTCGKHSRSNGFISKNTRLYRAWSNMKSRCYWEKDKSFKNYGSRGITVCDEWKDNFRAFHSWALQTGYNDNLTLDRIDTDGNYAPDNCRWVTIKEQESNKRNNRKIYFNGESLTTSEWARKMGMNPITLFHRLSAGWSTEKALLTPVRRWAR